MIEEILDYIKDRNPSELILEGTFWGCCAYITIGCGLEIVNRYREKRGYEKSLPQQEEFDFKYD
ncbi:MAG: hypothetical protein ABIE22_05580 [archaeon]